MFTKKTSKGTTLKLYAIKYRDCDHLPEIQRTWATNEDHAIEKFFSGDCAGVCILAIGLAQAMSGNHTESNLTKLHQPLYQS